ncbi:site-specific DNA-methyltransferase [Dendrosporobacter sp. 1207_IL3150]|uniref:site-specific DNA-methyltransferase n=1 Tax=Dendrosporobacter sp. 1207_IL3150 TaxID=3084054 RepID=UPI002FDB410E
MPILNWLDRDETIKVANKVPFRLLEADDTLSYGEQSDNMIIQGDNLEALKALLPYYKGQVKCIYIDPPYNTKSAFEHYDDNLEHSQWLNMMYPRLELLQEFLREDGSIWVSIDDNEVHYLKVIMDEIFGRSNFVANVVWQKRTSPDMRSTLGAGHDHIIVYAQDYERLKNVFHKLPKTPEQIKAYKNPDNDHRGPWVSTDCTAQAGHGTKDQFYKLTTPAGRIIELPASLCWRFTQKRMQEEIEAGRIWFGKDGKGVPRKKTFLSEAPGINAWTWWTNTEVGHNQEGKKEINQLFGADNAFATPKPERLLQRILQLCSDSGDLIMDSFLGSGTTAAVAHKMGRRYIGIEMGDHAVTHVVPRMKKVVDGEEGGISKTVNWQGGGGFRFYKLGEAVIDEFGHLNSQVKFPALAAHIWFTETKTPYTGEADSPLIGIHEGTAYYLLYNGILGDKRPDSGNVLTTKMLNALPLYDGPKVIYGEASRLGEARLNQLDITFKQTPYDIKMR